MGSKKAKSTTTVQLDPQTQQLNALRLEQERLMEPLRAMGRTELGKIFNPQYRLPGVGVKGKGSLTPGGPEMITQGPSTYTTSTGEVIRPRSMEEVYASLPGLAEMMFASPEEAFSASRRAALTDVTGLEQSAKKHIDQIVAPQLISQAIAMGMGRGGAPLESISKAGASLAMPIEQARMTAEQQLADYVSSRGERRQGFASGVSQPSAPFTSAPTTTTTSRSGGGFMDFLLPGLSLLAAPFTGGYSAIPGLLGFGAAAAGAPAAGSFGGNIWNPGNYSLGW